MHKGTNAVLLLQEFIKHLEDHTCLVELSSPPLKLGKHGERGRERGRERERERERERGMIFMSQRCLSQLSHLPAKVCVITA